jgi:hypothetical protein
MEISGVQWVFGGRELPVSKKEVAHSHLRVWPRSGHDEDSYRQSSVLAAAMVVDRALVQREEKREGGHGGRGGALGGPVSGAMWHAIVAVG